MPINNPTLLLGAYNIEVKKYPSQRSTESKIKTY
jgi:hypothetical protein